MLVGVTDLHLSKTFVSFQLVKPGNEEDDGEDPRCGWNGGKREVDGGGGGSKHKPWGLTEIASPSTEVVSKTHNVVGDVHGGLARLVDKDTLIQPPEYLEGQQEEDQGDAAGVGVDRPGCGAHQVQP